MTFDITQKEHGNAKGTNMWVVCYGLSPARVGDLPNLWTVLNYYVYNKCVCVCVCVCVCDKRLIPHHSKHQKCLTGDVSLWPSWQEPINAGFSGSPNDIFWVARKSRPEERLELTRRCWVSVDPVFHHGDGGCLFCDNFGSRSDRNLHGSMRMPHLIASDANRSYTVEQNSPEPMDTWAMACLHQIFVTWNLFTGIKIGSSY